MTLLAPHWDTKNYSPPEVNRIWGIWGSYYNIPKAMFYLLKGDYTDIATHSYSFIINVGLRQFKKATMFNFDLVGPRCWVAVKELKLSYHNGCVYIYSK